MLYTRKGDNGTSGLFGTKERYQKDDVLYEALGTLDELNSLLGLCYAKVAKEKTGTSTVLNALRSVQERLFIIQAQLAGAHKHISEAHTDELEAYIADLETMIENPHGFVIPGASELSAWFDYARAVSRRAERSVVRMSRTRDVLPETLRYLNRLSSLLYVLARLAATIINAEEISPSYI